MCKKSEDLWDGEETVEWVKPISPIFVGFCDDDGHIPEERAIHIVSVLVMGEYPGGTFPERYRILCGQVPGFGRHEVGFDEVAGPATCKRCLAIQKG